LGTRQSGWADAPKNEGEGVAFNRTTMVTRLKQKGSALGRNPGRGPCPVKVAKNGGVAGVQRERLVLKSSEETRTIHSPEVGSRHEGKPDEHKRKPQSNMGHVNPPQTQWGK